MTLDTIAARIADVKRRMAAAAKRVGRDPTTIRLIAVGKTKPAEVLAEAYACGQRAFGENYAQELDEKRKLLARLPEIEWHFIGRLQTNKARLVAPTVALVHTVDSVRLATELGRRRLAVRPDPVGVLVELNLGAEPQKGGIAVGDLTGLLRALETTPGIRLEGLMCVPPPTPTAEQARPFHRAMRELRDSHGGPARLPVLSMGMTQDFEVAIEEGSTLVRVGSALFGLRDSKI